MSFVSEVTADTPTLWWDTRQASGASQPDRSGNGHTGTISGSPTLGADGLVFAGGQVITGTDEPLPDGELTAFTVEAVVKTVTFDNATGFVCGLEGDDFLDLYAIDSPRQTFEIGYRDPSAANHSLDGATPITSTASLTHVVAEYDGTDLSIYVNGVLDGTATPGAGPNIGTALFYAGGDGLGDNITATIQHAILYDHALGSTRVAAHAVALNPLDPDPPPPDPVVIRVIDIDGNSHTSSGLTDGQLPFARAEQITRTRNEPSDAVIPFPKYAYSRDDVHIFADDSGTGELHLIEIVRNGIVRFRGFAVVAEGGSGNGEITLHCKGIDWALAARFLDGQRTNELTNPSFETGDETGYAPIGAVVSTVTTDDAIRGTHSLRLESISPLGDIYEEQTVSITGTGIGTFITIVYYFKLETIGGHAVDRRGLYVEGRIGSDVLANNYYPIDEATPTGEWIRAKTTIAVPAFATWDINVRLYSPPGSILWDDGQMVAMQSISTASITGNTFEAVDVSEIVALVLAHVQNSAVGKSDLGLTLDTDTVGVKQVKHIQWADHIAWPDQMAEWLDRDDCFDYFIRNNLDGTNELVVAVPVQGVDRRSDITLQFPDVNVPPIVASFELTEDGGSTITDDTELDDDTGDGPDREEGHYADASEVGGLTLQTVTAAPTKSEPSSLDPLAREKVKKARRPAQLLTITINGAEPIDGTPIDELLGIGDVVTLALDDGWIQVDGFGRISQIVEFPRDRRLQVTIPVAVP